MNKFVEKECLKHGKTTFFLRKDSNSYRCLQCRRDYASNWTKKQRLKAVNYLGGKCKICGYSRCTAALVFHHRDPSQKKFLINNATAAKPWKILKEEIDKCDLLCANCHAEIHYGELPEHGKGSDC